MNCKRYKYLGIAFVLVIQSAFGQVEVKKIKSLSLNTGCNYYPNTTISTYVVDYKLDDTVHLFLTYPGAVNPRFNMGFQYSVSLNKGKFYKSNYSIGLSIDRQGYKAHSANMDRFEAIDSVFVVFRSSDYRKYLIEIPLSYGLRFDIGRVFLIPQLGIMPGWRIYDRMDSYSIDHNGETNVRTTYTHRQKIALTTNINAGMTLGLRATDYVSFSLTYTARQYTQSLLFRPVYFNNLVTFNIAADLGAIKNRKSGKVLGE
jgi:hypothetical protein